MDINVKVIMNENTYFLGCFVSGPSVNWDDSLQVKEQAKEDGALFRASIWGANGIADVLKKLKHCDYGEDLKTLLFQFYLNPLPYEMGHLKNIEGYRTKERSIGIPIVINLDSFLKLKNEEKFQHLTEVILEKLDLLEGVVRKKKLDCNVAKLKNDLLSVLSDRIIRGDRGTH